MTEMTGPLLDDGPPLSGAEVGRWNGQESVYDRLKERHQLVVDHYVMDPTSFPNAVISAGYSKRSVASMAHKLHNNPSIQAAIAEKMQERVERTMITQDRILHELAGIAFSDLTNYDIDPLTGQISLGAGVPDYVMRAVSSIKFISTIDESGHVRQTLEFKLWDKLGALRLIGQHLAMFTDKIQLGGEIDVRQKWDIGGKEIVF